MRRLFAILADLGDGDGFAFVGRRGHAGSVERLQPLRIGKPDRQAARNIHGDVVAADGKTVGVDETAVGEDANRRRAAAHVDECSAELGLVVHERGKCGRIRRRHGRFDLQMTALDDQHQVAGRRSIAADDMQVGAEIVAHHPLGIANAARPIERKAGRQRMQHGAALPLRPRRGCFEHAMNIVVGNRPAADGDLRIVELRAEPAARQIDDDALDLDPGHAFGGIDGVADGVLRRAHIDDSAALDAARPAMADPENATAMRASAQRFGRLRRHQMGNQADHLRSADVEDRKMGTAARREWPHPRRETARTHVGAPLSVFLRQGLRPRRRRLFRDPGDETAGNA